MEILITLRLPKKIVREMNVYRKRYHPSKLTHIESHISLVAPFILRGGLSDLMADLKRHCASQSSFLMRIDGIGSFNNDVIFFKPNCPPELKRFHRTVKALVASKYHSTKRSRHDRYWGFRVYRPHVTIAWDAPENIKAHKQELQGMKYERRFTVSGMNLYSRANGVRWLFQKAFRFGGITETGFIQQLTKR